jgi:hypothetical protein
MRDAEHLQIPKSTLYNLVEDQVPGRRSRFHWEAVDSWLAQGPRRRGGRAEARGAKLTAPRSGADLGTHGMVRRRGADGRRYLSAREDPTQHRPCRDTTVRGAARAATPMRQLMESTTTRRNAMVRPEVVRG